MFPEDRVLIGVINRKVDFAKARDEHWYRIPRDRAPKGIDAEYLAFYLSGSFKSEGHGVYYFAKNLGHELVYRRDLLPGESEHPRANQVYYMLQLGELQPKIPPITNPNGRSISFIYTTWDRFIAANIVADLYSKADWYVERVNKILRREGIISERIWEAEDPIHRVAELRIRCERGIVAASAQLSSDLKANQSTAATEITENNLRLTVGETDQEVKAGVEAIQQAVRDLGGAVFIDIPTEG